jgi:hypothetical protein
LIVALAVTPVPWLVLVWFTNNFPGILLESGLNHQAVLQQGSLPAIVLPVILPHVPRSVPPVHFPREKAGEYWLKRNSALTVEAVLLPVLLTQFLKTEPETYTSVFIVVVALNSVRTIVLKWKQWKAGRKKYDSRPL